MNKRLAKRLADEDSTPYTVIVPGRHETRIRVTGYPSARAILGRRHGVILTASETAALTRRPYLTEE